ncbi:MAG: hypothetical protein PHT51_00565 [Patescibacteria group bacterium]|nr:hypothetical protein [Patescibacteria group bacterium]MDD4610736.1 hypothetical protein [Patescibacteria group bacterium]
MAETLKPKTPGNINDWAKALEKVNPKLSAALNEDRSIGIKNLKKLNLPRYKDNHLALTDFLQDPQKGIKNLKTTTFAFNLIPLEKNMPRNGGYDKNIDQIISFVNQRIAKEEQINYDIIISQYFENIYGGNIIVGEDGKALTAEFKKGGQSDIARGKIIPEFSVTRDPYTDSFRYSFTDEKLRELIYKSILTVPHEGEGRDMKFIPGYYEFVIIQKDEKSPMEVLFIDCKLNPAFCSLPK